MFDIEGLKKDAIAKVNSAIARCRDGWHTGDRAARASFLLHEEANTIVARHLRDNFQFEPQDFPAYVEAFPTLLSYPAAGDIAASVSDGVRWHITRMLAPEVREMIFEQHPSPTLAALLDNLEAAISGTLDLIPQFRGHHLKRMMQECRNGADEQSLSELRGEIARQAEEMRSLIHRLDIADPPTADYAGRGRRLLLEAHDLVDLTIRRGTVAGFCSELPVSEATP